MAIRVGELNQFIRIEAPVTVRGTDGDEATTWETVVEAWGKIEPISGKEYLEAKQKGFLLTHQITTRYLRGIKPVFRLRVGIRIFTQASPPIDLEERREWLQFQCVEQFG